MSRVQAGWWAALCKGVSEWQRGDPVRAGCRRGGQLRDIYTAPPPGQAVSVVRHQDLGISHVPGSALDTGALGRAARMLGRLLPVHRQPGTVTRATCRARRAGGCWRGARPRGQLVGLAGVSGQRDPGQRGLRPHPHPHPVLRGRPYLGPADGGCPCE